MVSAPPRSYLFIRTALWFSDVLCVFRAARGREACLFEFGDEASVVILDFGGGARARARSIGIGDERWASRKGNEKEQFGQAGQ